MAGRAVHQLGADGSPLRSRSPAPAPPAPQDREIRLLRPGRTRWEFGRRPASPVRQDGRHSLGTPHGPGLGPAPPARRNPACRGPKWLASLIERPGLSPMAGMTGRLEVRGGRSTAGLARRIQTWLRRFGPEGFAVELRPDRVPRLVREAKDRLDDAAADDPYRPRAESFRAWSGPRCYLEPPPVGRRPRWGARRPSRGRGGTGRRTGFRFQWRKSWGFESLRPHQPAWFRIAPASRSAAREPRSGRMSSNRTGTIDHAGDRNPVRGLEARIQGRAPGQAELEQRLDDRARRPQGQGPHQRLPSRQGAGRASARASMAARSWPTCVQNAVNEANRKIVDDNSLKLALEPQVEFPERQGRDREGAWTPRATSPSRSRSRCCRTSSSADLADVQLDEAGRRGRRRARSTKRSSAWPRRTAPFAARARAPRPPTATASSIDFVGTHRRRARSRAARARTSTVELGSSSSSRASRTSSSAPRPARQRTVKVDVPGELRRPTHLAGKAAEFDVTVKEVAGAGRARRSTTSSPRASAWKSLDKLQGRDPRRDRSATTTPQLAPQAEAGSCSTRSTASTPSSCRRPGRAGIRGRLGAGRGRHEDRRQDLRGRGHHRGGGARRVPQDRRAPRSPRPGACAVGEKADIKVSDDEVTQALVERVRQFPGQEKQVWEFYRKNPQALAELRAPIFEEKVVDHILAR